VSSCAAVLNLWPDSPEAVSLCAEKSIGAIEARELTVLKDVVEF